MFAQNAAHIIEVLLYVGSSLGFEQSFSICALFSPSVHIHCSWSGESVVSRRKLPADVGKVLEGEGGTVRSGWRLLGQAADDCFLTAMRESCCWTDHNPLVKEMFSLYLGPPGCHASLLICSSAPSSCRTLGWQLDVTQMLCELVPECHQVWILALLMA